MVDGADLLVVSREDREYFTRPAGQLQQAPLRSRLILGLCGVLATQARRAPEIVPMPQFDVGAAERAHLGAAEALHRFHIADPPLILVVKRYLPAGQPRRAVRVDLGWLHGVKWLHSGDFRNWESPAVQDEPISDAARILGERVRKRLQHFGLSQEAMAEQIGIHWTFLGRAERTSATSTCTTSSRSRTGSIRRSWYELLLSAASGAPAENPARSARSI